MGEHQFYNEFSLTKEKNIHINVTYKLLSFFQMSRLDSNTKVMFKRRMRLYIITSILTVNLEHFYY
jgi:hypothetical protein